jgi:hypothetical protein
MNKEELLKAMEGIDKRTVKYKELKEQLELLESTTPEKEYQISDEVYETINSFNGRVKGQQVDWIFNTYNEIFNTKNKKCLCGGKIKKMLIKMTKTYEKERR